MGYFFAISDYPNALKCAKLCIEAGEGAGILLHPSLAYGILARAAIAKKDYEEAISLTGCFFKLCYDNGIYEYFRMRRAYDPVLEFAYDNGIEPEITRQLMEFAGFRPKKVYIVTLGAFTVYQDRDRQKLVKFRTKEERELLTLLLDAGDRGVTKEQIYNAIWRDSDSKNIKNLIAVNLRHLKNDLECAGIAETIICREHRYSICRDEIACDSDLLKRYTKNLGLIIPKSWQESYCHYIKESTCLISKPIGLMRKELDTMRFMKKSKNIVWNKTRVQGFMGPFKSF